MARKAGGTILREELYSPGAELAPEPLDDPRPVDLDIDEQSPFLRAQKRVSARRSSLPKRTANRLLWASIAAMVLCVAALVGLALYQYGEHSWRFRIESSDNIEIAGTDNVTKAQIMEVMGADIGRNIFFVPLTQQREQLEQISWVESASVMRFVPNRVRVEIHERTPVAFARVGPRILLIDAAGTLMDLPPKHKYSFPVILGMNPGEPISTRLPRMKAYNELVQELDSGGARYSQDLSEVDLSDLENLKVQVNDSAGDVLVELGSGDYLKRFKTYVGHVQEWRQQFQKLESVNLRYDNQVIVNPDVEGKSKPAALSAATAKAAAAAGVKPAVSVTKIGPHDRSIPKPAFELADKKLIPKSAAKKPAAKAKKNAARAGKSVRKTIVASASKAPGNAAVPAAVGRASAQPTPGTKDNAGAAALSSKTPASAAASGGSKPSPVIVKQQGNTGSN